MAYCLTTAVGFSSTASGYGPQDNASGYAIWLRVVFLHRSKVPKFSFGDIGHCFGA
jgi:hypothetical protein